MKMLKNQKRRSWWSRLSLAIPVFALLIYVFACEMEEISVNNTVNNTALNEDVEWLDPLEAPEDIYEDFLHFKNLYPGQKLAIVMTEHVDNTRSVTGWKPEARIAVFDENESISVYAIVKEDKINPHKKYPLIIFNKAKG